MNKKLGLMLALGLILSIAIPITIAVTSNTWSVTIKPSAAINLNGPSTANNGDVMSFTATLSASMSDRPVWLINKDTGAEVAGPVVSVGRVAVFNNIAAVNLSMADLLVNYQVTDVDPTP